MGLPKPQPVVGKQTQNAPAVPPAEATGLRRSEELPGITRHSKLLLSSLDRPLQQSSCVCAGGRGGAEERTVERCRRSDAGVSMCTSVRLPLCAEDKEPAAPGVEPGRRARLLLCRAAGVSTRCGPGCNGVALRRRCCGSGCSACGIRCAG